MAKLKSTRQRQGGWIAPRTGGYSPKVASEIRSGRPPQGPGSASTPLAPTPQTIPSKESDK